MVFWRTSSLQQGSGGVGEVRLSLRLRLRIRLRLRSKAKAKAKAKAKVGHSIFFSCRGGSICVFAMMVAADGIQGSEAEALLKAVQSILERYHEDHPKDGVWCRQLDRVLAVQAKGEV